MYLFQRKYRALLGLDITTSSVKLIELAMAGEVDSRVKPIGREACAGAQAESG